MVFSWRHRKDTRRVGKKKLSRVDSCKELTIPSHFLCPISLDLMKDPVTLCTGITYDRENIEKWIEEGNSTCPVTNIQALKSTDHMIPNHAIRKMIQDWCVENKKYGIERVPTPRIPVTSSQVTEICSRLTVEAQRGNGEKCMELVGRVRILAKESERNKKCIVECGTGSVFAACFEIFSVGVWEELSMELLSALTWMFPIGGEGVSRLVSSTSLRCMARFLKGEDLSGRQNAVVVMKELLCYHDHQSCSNVLTEIQELAESLYQMVKVPICPSATKASLMVIHSIICENDKNIVSKFVNMGLVSLILEILVDCEKATTEKALAVLDSICNFEEGKEKAYEHGLTIALITKKIMRVSEMATECSISVLWKLLVCKNGHDDHENSVIEALELGAFQKLLVVLQVGCGENTKEKVTELLKLMNLYKDRVDCFDGSTFKYLNKSY